MKLKPYLREQYDMSYAEFRKLPEERQWEIRWDLDHINRKEQARKTFIASGGKISPMTDEIREEFSPKHAAERKHYELSEKCGGISGNGYIALHYRH